MSEIGNEAGRAMSTLTSAAIVVVGVVALGSAAAAPTPHDRRPPPAKAEPAAAARALAAEDEGTPGAESSGSPESSPSGTPPLGLSSEGLEVTDFRQREPEDGDPASVATRALLSYDKDNLHIVFVCDDDPTQIRAHVVPRDKITDDDRVAVFLDTFDDNQRAYAFEVNPHGIQRDGIITEGQDDDYTFDALWQSEGRLTPTGYVVRMEIPFSSLRFANRAVQTWGIALARYVERTSEKSYWPYITERVEGFVNQLGSLQGLEQISPGRRFQAVPYSAMTNFRFLDDEPDVAGYRQARESRYGVDLKAVLHDAVTVDLAVKPDFSQVEPDAPQVTVNERFEKRVDEKRPFFIENAGYFETPLELFFSRRIQDPERGARVTSKMGSWAVGALLMDDREPGRVEADDPLFGKRAHAGVVRVQKEFGDQSTLGFFASGLELAGDQHRVFAADMRLKVGSNWVATGHVAQTQTPELAAPYDGVGGYFNLKREGRGFDCAAEYLSLAPGFSAPLGFIPRVGIKQAEGELEYTFRPKKRLVKAWGPKANATVVYDWNRRLQDAELELSGKIELPADTRLEAAWEGAYELFEDLEFLRYTNKVDVETEWLKWLDLSVTYRRGTAVNHDPPKRTLPFLAIAQETDVSVTLRTSHLEFKQSASYGWLRTPRLDPALGPVARPIYANWILESKLKLQLSRELSVRAIVNYEALIPNPALTREDEEREVLPDVLITYLVNPWTALHAGYTERFENVLLRSGEVVEAPRSVRDFEFPSTSVDRQFFMKVSYLIQF